MGFEPTTSTLARLRSTTELHPLYLTFAHVELWCGSGAIILISPALASLFFEKINFLRLRLAKIVV